MLHITIISIGKLKEQYWKDAEKEYLKRLSAFAKVEIKELKEESFTEKDNVEIIKEKEAKKILSAVASAKAGIDALPKDSYIVVLDKEGKQFSSEELSKHISTTTEQHHNITIIIGGPLGLHNSILNLAKESWSLSKMTFTHQMTRIILLEQLYRGFMIKENRKYHY
ncbi:MAG: 23S rRNA (pseudouridine(1915)-N(3))-methyltransferase RlmH [Candidatus Magasanikbacteria bacterium]